MCDLNQSATESALAHFQTALEQPPNVDDLGRVLLYLATSLKELERFGEALPHLDRAVEIDPTSALDWASLGSNLRDLGRVDEAIAAYRRALDLDPTIGFAAENITRLLRAETGVSDISDDPAPRD